MNYKEWLEWRKKYFNLEDESLGYDDALSNWGNEGGSTLVNLPTGVYED